MEEQVSFILDLANEKMKDSLAHLNIELSKIRAGRASTSVLDGIMVEYYGSKTAISQVGNINTPDPKTIIIQPWEKDLINEIKNAINTSNIGFSDILHVVLSTPLHKIILLTKPKPSSEQASPN